MKILMIEDEIALSEAVCRALKAENIASEARYDGESGLDEALTGAYEAIILDVMLPKMDGFEILREIRREGIHTPVVMLTARSELKSRVEGLDSGADYYLTKPFE
ncbi:MAG: response regulator, partial [Clostridia bacterium]|nr:response regulator [Clostridia bacterium]